LVQNPFFIDSSLPVRLVLRPIHSVSLSERVLKGLSGNDLFLLLPLSLLIREGWQITFLLSGKTGESIDAGTQEGSRHREMGHHCDKSWSASNRFLCGKIEYHYQVCPLCPGQEEKTPPEVLSYRSAGSLPNTTGWNLRVVPNKFPALQVEGNLDREGIGLYDRMNGIGAHEVVIEHRNTGNDGGVFGKTNGRCSVGLSGPDSGSEERQPVSLHYDFKIMERLQELLSNTATVN